jgi:hypothetical protein
MTIKKDIAKKEVVPKDKKSRSLQGSRHPATEAAVLVIHHGQENRVGVDPNDAVP